MKKITDIERNAISGAFDELFKTQQPEMRDRVLKFIYSVVNFDRKMLTVYFIEHAMSLMHHIVNAKGVLGRPMHPDAMVMLLALLSRVVPLLKEDTRELTKKFLDIAGMPDGDVPVDASFTERYKFDETVYEQFDEILGEHDFLKHHEASVSDKVSFKRVDIDEIPRDILAALKKMGIDVSDIEGVEVLADEPDKSVKH